LLESTKNIRSQQPFTSGFCIIFKLHLLLFICASFFLLHSLTYATELKEEKRVLILFNNRSDLPAIPFVEKGLKSSLAAGTEFHIEYFIEYMDYYRNPDQTYNQLLLDLYRHKFSRHKIDLVFAWGPQSHSLVVAHSKGLFPQTPVVLSGILREQLKGENLGPVVAGVLLDIDYAGLLETALRIHPQTRHVAIVNGASKTDLILEKGFRKALEPYARRLDFIYLTRLPMGEIVEKVQNLPEHSVVLYYTLLRDGEGKIFIPREVASILSGAANAPVYGCLDTYLGHGIVGGRMTSIEMTGVKAGELALRILRGEKPSDIHLTSHGTIVDMFDWRQLKRWGISEDRLPPGSVVRYKTYSYWELHRWHIVTAVVVLLLQSGLITFLLKQRAQRRHAQVQLAERLRFEEMLSALSGRFINLPTDQLDFAIAHVLESISKGLGVDRISVFELSEADKKLSLIHSYKAADIASLPSEIQFREIPWITQKLINNELLTISNSEDLPADAEPDRTFVRSQGTVSFVLIPLTTGARTLGVLSFAMLRHRKTWSQELVRQCRLVAEVLTNALLRKQHEASKIRAEQKYRTVADFTYDWEYWENLDGLLEYVSPSCKRITGYSVQDFMGNPSLLNEIIVPEDRDLWDRHFHDSRQKLMPCEMQFRIQRRDGQICWIEHNCQPVIDAQGHLQGFRASNRDITARKRVEEGIRVREKDLRRLATQLISAHEEERRSLARELHDDLSQRLAALAIQAGKMEQQIVNEQALDAGECSRHKDGIIAISNDVHSLSRQLHPSILDDLGLTRAVESECRRFTKREGIEVAFTPENIPTTLSKDVCLSIYRIIQEGLNNISKHACANRAKVELQRTDGSLCLSIQDDGIGFDAAEVRQKLGLGLSSMRERARIIQGVLSITSEPERGTTITVRVPLEKSSRTKATPADLE
jgi:PAS domain S-box-containing protein